MNDTKIFFTGRKEICENTFAFTFNLYDSEYDFKAGQYAYFTIMDPVHHDENGYTRPLSFANSPDHINSLMVAARKTQSVFVENLLSLTPGSELQISEPRGDVYLHGDETVENVFIAGGIGITPVRSIIEFATENDLRNRITLFYSNKSFSQAAFMNELIEWAAENENFTFIPFFEDTQVNAEFEFETGRIDQEKMIKHLQNFDNKRFFIVGPPVMVDSINDLLINNNVSKENIMTERFM